MTQISRQRLKELRKAREWSQAELSRRTGIHATTISHLESGAVKLWPKYARLIARELGVSVDDLRGAA